MRSHLRLRADDPYFQQINDLSSKGLGVCGRGRVLHGTRQRVLAIRNVIARAFPDSLSGKMLSLSETSVYLI